MREFSILTKSISSFGLNGSSKAAKGVLGMSSTAKTQLVSLEDRMMAKIISEAFSEYEIDN